MNQPPRPPGPPGARPPVPGPPGGQIPLLGRQPTDKERQEQLRIQISQSIQQLATQIYAQAAVAQLVNQDPAYLHPGVDPARLQQLARDAQLAGKCFYQGLGIAQFDDVPPETDPPEEEPSDDQRPQQDA